MLSKFGFVLTLSTLVACTSEASHLPPLHQLPGAAVGSAIENSRYKARRKKVKATIQPHVDFILTEADRGGGPTFDLTCEVANVSPKKCKLLAHEISEDDHIYRAGTLAERVEKLTVAFMVYGD